MNMPFVFQASRRPAIRNVFLSAAAACMVIAVCGAASVGSLPYRLIAYLTNVELWVDPACVDFGEQAAGQTVTGSVAVRNFSNEDMTVLAAETSCECASVHQLPANIPRNSSADVPIALRMPSRSGIVEQSATFLCKYGDGVKKSVTVQLRARSVAGLGIEH